MEACNVLDRIKHLDISHPGTPVVVHGCVGRIRGQAGWHTLNGRHGLVVDHGGDGGCLVLDGVALVDVLLDGDVLPRSLHTDNLRKAGSGRP